jgi:predicted HAD superfamily phosphohydrolase YqeG
MLRRVPMSCAADLDHLETMVTAADAPMILVFDADNTLVPQGVSLAEFQSGVEAAIERFEQIPNVQRVIVLTNGPDRGVPSMIFRGNKPWTTRGRLGIPKRGTAAWIVGDQILTDGLLAWRLGATYIHLAIEQTEAVCDLVLYPLLSALYQSELGDLPDRQARGKEGQ